MTEKWLMGTKLLYGFVGAALLGAVVHIKEFKDAEKLKEKEARER